MPMWGWILLLLCVPPLWQLLICARFIREIGIALAVFMFAVAFVWIFTAHWVAAILATWVIGVAFVAVLYLPRDEREWL